METRSASRSTRSKSRLNDSLIRNVTKTAQKKSKTRRRSQRLSLFDAYQMAQRNTPSKEDLMSGITETMPPPVVEATTSSSHEVVPLAIETTSSSSSESHITRSDHDEVTLEKILQLPLKETNDCIKGKINEYKKVIKEQNDWLNLIKKYKNEEPSAISEVEEVIELDSNVISELRNIENETTKLENQFYAILQNKMNVLENIKNISDSMNYKLTQKRSGWTRKVDPRLLIKSILEDD